MSEKVTRDEMIKNMAENLPVLRTRLHLTQSELAAKLGISRQTVIALESGKRPMTWSTFLSLVFIFSKYEETQKLLGVLDIYPQEFEEDFLSR